MFFQIEFAPGCLWLFYVIAYTRESKSIARIRNKCTLKKIKYIEMYNIIRRIFFLFNF